METHAHNLQMAMWVLLPTGAIAYYVYTSAVHEVSDAISKIDCRKVDWDLWPEPKLGVEKSTERLFFTCSLFSSWAWPWRRQQM